MIHVRIPEHKQDNCIVEEDLGGPDVRDRLPNLHGPSYNICGASLDNRPPRVVSEDAHDFLERALDANIEHNAQDFVRWYRSNIIVQTAIILSSLLATIFASITTKDNAETLKRYTILLTALTSGLTAVQSTFHIRENIEVFIKVNSELMTLEGDYLADRAKYLKDGKVIDDKNAAAALDKIQSDVRRKLAEIQSARMHAYSSIGAQSLSVGGLVYNQTDRRAPADPSVRNTTGSK